VSLSNIHHLLRPLSRVAFVLCGCLATRASKKKPKKGAAKK
jgi:hypothetical protein